MNHQLTPSCPPPLLGEEELKKLSHQCQFPWLLTNILDGEGKPPANGLQYLVLERNGVRIGFMGLAEKEWIDTLPDPPESIRYTDFIESGRQWVQVR